MARIDVAGRVIEKNDRFTTIRVENWCADGYYMDFAGRSEEFVKSSAAEARKFAKNR
jgi:hypothetical protein